MEATRARSAAFTRNVGRGIPTQSFRMGRREGASQVAGNRKGLSTVAGAPADRFVVVRKPL
jgi:hypothetical protein